MPSYTTAKIMTAIQETAGIALTVIGGVGAAITFGDGSPVQAYALPVAAIAVGLTLTVAAQLTRAMIATAESTAAMLAIMQRQAQQERTERHGGAPQIRTEPRFSAD